MVLYKYIKPDLTDIFKNGLIRFTQPCYFNDPFDSLPNVKTIFDIDFVKLLFTSLSNSTFEQDIKKLSFKVETQQSLIEFHHIFKKMNKEELLNYFIELTIGKPEKSLSEDIRKYWDYQIGILSLSETNDNLTMWAHYSIEHTGFVLGFDTNKLITESNKCLIKPRKVTYQCERPSIVFIDTKKDKTEMIQDWINIFLYTKSKDWSYENEWRQVNILKYADKIENKDKKDIYLFKYNRDSIVEIYFGCRIDIELRKKILDYIVDWKIDKYDMRINNKNYILDKIELTGQPITTGMVHCR